MLMIMVLWTESDRYLIFKQAEVFPDVASVFCKTAFVWNMLWGMKMPNGSSVIQDDKGQNVWHLEPWLDVLGLSVCATNSNYLKCFNLLEENLWLKTKRACSDLLESERSELWKLTKCSSLKLKPWPLPLCFVRIPQNFMEIFQSGPTKRGKFKKSCKKCAEKAGTELLKLSLKDKSCM